MLTCLVLDELPSPFFFLALLLLLASRQSWPGAPRMGTTAAALHAHTNRGYQRAQFKEIAIGTTSHGRDRSRPGADSARLGRDLAGAGAAGYGRAWVRHTTPMDDVSSSARHVSRPELGHAHVGMSVAGQMVARPGAGGHLLRRRRLRAFEGGRGAR